jgi:UDP-glucose 4-epimerase
MVIAITGISGFLGSNLFKAVSSKYDTIGISTSQLHQQIEGVYPFSNIEKIDKIPEVVIHCHAAISSGANHADREKLFAGNVKATNEIVNRFPFSNHIFISSCSIYGTDSSIKTENSNIHPVTEYALSKLWAERIVLQSNNAVIIRLSSLYGIGMKENTILPNFINQALENNIIKVWGNGNRIQNYIHVSDIVKLIDQVIEHNNWNKQTYLGVAVEEYSNAALAQIISNLTNAEIVFVNEDNSPSNYYDNSYTRNELNWQPMAEISSEIKKYIEWKRKLS